MPLEFSTLLRVTAEVYKLREAEAAAKIQIDSEGNRIETAEEKARRAEEREEENRDLQRLTVAGLVVRTHSKTQEMFPVFSYNGKGGNVPIEDQSDLLLGKLYGAVMEVQAPPGSVDALRRFQGISGDDGDGKDSGT